MLLLAEQPDTFYLRIQNPAEQDDLHKKEIVIRWSISPDRGFTWEYVRHEFFERPALATDWTMTESYQVRLTDGLKALIKSHLEWEIWEEFWDSRDSANTNQRLPIDRRRLFQFLLTFRLSKMCHPRNVTEAIFAVRRASRLGTNEFAAALGTNHSSISLAEAGKRSLPSSTMKKLEMMANRVMEWKVAEYLRSMAMVARLNLSRKGGHR